MAESTTTKLASLLVSFSDFLLYLFFFYRINNFSYNLSLYFFGWLYNLPLCANLKNSWHFTCYTRKAKGQLMLWRNHESGYELDFWNTSILRCISWWSPIWTTVMINTHTPKSLVYIKLSISWHMKVSVMCDGSWLCRHVLPQSILHFCLPPQQKHGADLSVRQ